MFSKINILSILLVTLVSFLSGCDFVYRMIDKQGAEEKTLVGEAMPFEPNPTVEEIQKLLNIYGYNVGKTDGVLGTRTRNSIEKFQRDNGIEPSRFVDNQTWDALKRFKDNGFIGEGELNIEKIQEALSYAGYAVGKIDGKFGPRSKKALLAFQKDHNLKSDGKIGYKTLTALSLYIR